MPFDTAQVSPESRTRDRLTRRSSGSGEFVPRPLALNLRADIGVRVARPLQKAPRTEQEACWRFLDRAAGRSR